MFIEDKEMIILNSIHVVDMKRHFLVCDEP
mgnify:CR=1 FL=1